MDPDRPTAPDLRRVFLSVAVIAFTGGFLVASWALTTGGAPSTAAGLFPVTTVDLQLQSSGGPGDTLHAFIGNPNFVPGDMSRGTITLVTSTLLPGDLYDLDLDVRNHLQGHKHPGALRLQDAITVTRFQYGNDDLLTGADGGRNLLREIDANPLLGNRDGRLSLAELEAGVNDLPPPRVADRGGTPLFLEVQVCGPHVERDRCEDLIGQTLDVRFVFYLAQGNEADLN